MADQKITHRVLFTFMALKEVTLEEVETALKIGFDKDTDIDKQSIKIVSFYDPE